MAALVSTTDSWQQSKATITEALLEGFYVANSNHFSFVSMAVTSYERVMASNGFYAI